MSLRVFMSGGVCYCRTAYAFRAVTLPLTWHAATEARAAEMRQEPLLGSDRGGAVNV